jgi:hypothetical protein
MANKKISELDIRTSLSLSDLLAVGDPTTGYLYKITITDLKTLTGAGVISFNGRIGSVSPAEGDYNLTQLGDVIITSASNNQILQYNGSNWVNATINLSGYVPYTGASANVDLGTFDLTTDIVTLNQVKAVGSGGISFNSNNGTQIAAMGGGGGANITFYGGMTGTTISLSSSATASSFIKTAGTSSQFLKADGSVDSSTYLTTSSAASTYVPLSRTLTINGTSYDLSTDRSWTINSMVYPGAGIAVSTGTAWGTSITDNSANWDAAYTARITSATSPLNITSNVISITQASTSTNGFLTGTDWNTFANKIGGSGASGYVSFFNGAASITGSTNLFWDAANNRLGVGTNTPSAGITSFSSTAATQFKAAGTAPAFTFSETLTSPVYGAVFGLATSAGQFVTGTAAGDMAIANQSQSAGAIVFGTGTTEGMRLTSAGTLSIGNTNSTYKLDVTGIGRFTTSLFVSSAGADTVSSGANIQFSSNAVIQTNTALGLDIWMNNSGTWNRKVTITNAGNFGIGTTSPANKLTISNDGNSAVAFRINDTNANASFLSLNASNVDSAIIAGGTSAIPFDIYTGGVARMRISSTGNVGIGTTNYFDGSGYGSTARYLTILNSSASSQIEISTNSTTNDSVVGGFDFINAANAGTSGSGRYGVAYVRGWIANASGTGNTSGGYITFGTKADGGNQSERMRIGSNGSVAIGSSSTNSAIRLAITGASQTSSNWSFIAADSLGGTIIGARNDGAVNTGTLSASPYNLTVATAANVFVDSAGFLYRAISSRKYKKDIINYDRGIDILKKLRPVFYKGISDYDGTSQYAGLIAEEVHDLGLTEFVQYAEDGTPDALAYSNMVALLVKAIQEQQAQIEQLKNK